MSMMRMPSNGRCITAPPGFSRRRVQPCPRPVNTLGWRANKGRADMPVDLIIEGAVAKVVLNRPERLNALTWEMRQQLREHFSELRFNEAIRAIIVTGEGRAFCTGADVGGMERKELRGEREKLQQGSHSYMRVLAAVEKPVIAAVRGPTVGIG